MQFENEKKMPNLAYVFFLYSGIASLLGWNALLTAFDFYHVQYPDYDVFFILPIPKFVSQVIALILIFKISKHFSINVRIYGLLVLMSILFVVLPLVAYYLPDNTGFWISMVLIFIFGFSNSVMQGSCIAITSLFPGKAMAIFFTGTGIAGLMISLLRVFILLGFGDSGNGLTIGTIVYFSISGFLQILTIVIYYVFLRTDYAKFYMEKSKKRTMSCIENISDQVVNAHPHVENTLDKNQNKEKLLGNTTEDEEKRNEIVKERVEEVSQEEIENYSPSDSKFVFKVLKKIWQNFFLCWVIYVATFMMFPGVTFKRTISVLSVSWSVTLLVLMFNICDTIGKYFGKIRKSYNQISTWIMVFGRFLFFLSFLVMATRNNATVISTDWFEFLNIAVFAITNGYATTAVMTMAPEQVKTKEKETCGFLMSFPLAFGIVCGTFLALVFKDL